MYDLIMDIKPFFVLSFDILKAYLFHYKQKSRETMIGKKVQVSFMGFDLWFIFVTDYVQGYSFSDNSYYSNHFP